MDTTPKLMVAGIGASAGGLAAITSLLTHLQPPTGIAYVVVQHLAPDPPSQLPEILARSCNLPVVWVTDRVVIVPDHVYVVPPRQVVSYADGHLTLDEAAPAAVPPVLIDNFFSSLAQGLGNRAIGVILSGSGSDGAAGMHDIRAAGGLTLAQKPDTADFTDMPDAVIRADLADFILAPADIARRLGEIGQHPLLKTTVDEGETDGFEAVLNLLLAGGGVDFHHYKHSTLERRILRRMMMRGAPTVAGYIEQLREDPGELAQLLEDMLIHVTAFFRDPEMFEQLKAKVFPGLVSDRAAGETIRIWVTACSTGEEAYSIAIALQEYLTEHGLDLSVRIFATDISEQVVAKARIGLFPHTIKDQVSPERLTRFFSHTPEGYRVIPALRDVCTFVRHDLTRDPPFSRLDLVSCRNLLIYMVPALQVQVLSLLHYALKQTGFLILGQSEGLAGSHHLFRPLDSSHRIFSRLDAPATGHLVFGRKRTADPLRVNQAFAGPRVLGKTDLASLTDRFLAERFGPASVLVDDSLDVVETRGQVGPYLELPSGTATLNVLRLARPGLLASLRSALRSARAQEMPVAYPDALVDKDRTLRPVNLEVVPLKVGPEPYFLILFQEPPVVVAELPGMPVPLTVDAGTEVQIRRLQQELAVSEDHMKSLIEQHEIATEELIAANEEGVSSNEELQSTNEELETAKEELQSANEELSTVNEQLQNRNAELNQLNDDLANLFDSVDIATIMLDQQGRIRRFNPQAQHLMRLIPTDIGRPIGDLRPVIGDVDVGDMVAAFLKEPTAREVVARDKATDQWYRLQIQSYRTSRRQLAGAVLTWVDVTALQRSVESADRLRHHAVAIVETIRMPLLILDDQMTVLEANGAFYETFGVAEVETLGNSLFMLGNGQWDIPELRTLIEAVLPAKGEVREYEVRHDFPGLGSKTMLLSARRMPNEHEGSATIIVGIQDVTERSELLSIAQRAQLAAEQANRAKDVFLATLSHELRTPLTTILGWGHVLQTGKLEADKTQHALKAITRAAQRQVQLIDDLMDSSRIAVGKLDLRRMPVDVGAVVGAAVETVRLSAEAKGIDLTVMAYGAPLPMVGDERRLEQVFWNLLNNAIKFTEAGGAVAVAVDRQDRRARVVVSDTGPGISPDMLDQVFDQFVQGDMALSRRHSGMGIGLSLVRHLVGLHGGTVAVHNGPSGQGAVFTVQLPLTAEPPESDGALPQAVVAVETTADEGKAAEGLPLGGLRLLVVDDEAACRDMLAEMLQLSGARVQQAASGQEAIAMLAEDCPEVLICDISMPDVDGITLLRSIRDLPVALGGAVPAIAVTALSNEHLDEELRAAGFQAFVPKPIDVRRLETVIVEVAAKGGR
jgi:two-component system CheB/CheR fusion protein